MRKVLHIVAAAAMFCALAQAQVPVVPSQFPHVTFVNASGGPCAGCTLQTDAAGTTTPLATYVDATGTSVNTNPVILDAAGGANIWVGRNSYKFILKDTLGNTIWTIDQVNAASLFPCGPANSIQISNSGVTGLTCDAQIYIDRINHTLNVGVMSVNHVTIGALGTPTTWFLDTTTPATACASIGCSTTTGTVTSASVVTANGVSATVATPSTTPAFTFTLGAITPTSVQIGAGVALSDNQGNGTKVQHSTGTTTTGNLVKFDALGNTVDSGLPSTSTFGAQTDITASRGFGISYQNTGTTPMYVSGYGTITGGSGDSTITCNVGSLSPSVAQWSNVVEATASGEHVAFNCMVPATYFYSVTVTNIISSTPGKWVEIQ